MTTAVLTPDLLPMSQRERDILKIMHPVLQGQRTGAEAARLLGRSTRQVRRLLRKLQDQGDAAIVHGLRGRPSNRRTDSGMRRAVVAAYKARYADFGPTLAAEKLAAEGLHVCRETLRRWLIAEGLWQRRRQREPHRSRRPRRDCFGELVQMDASFHDWLEGRGETLVLIALIDDATGRVLARFYEAGTVVTHMDLLRRWLRKYGRPLAVYTDRHSIFEPQDKGRAVALAETQFGRALSELGVELIRARSPQAKGRVERLFGTAQDRWVKELRLAGVRTALQANEVLARLLPAHNRKFAKAAKDSTDAHRDLGPAPARGKKARPPVKGAGLAYSRPPGARVALLQSPILPPATRLIAPKGRGVQPKITPGAGPSKSRSDIPLTPDISNVTEMRTF